MKTNNEIELMNVKTLVTEGKYLIPIYQRNYAWGESEVVQLIQDILDYSDKDQDYYIGTLIVYERDVNGTTIFETIDGQQRLTTLSIIMSVIKHEFNEIDTSWYHNVNVGFKSRDFSTNALKRLFDSGLLSASTDERASSINQAYKDALRKLRTISQDKLEKFFEYLLNRVRILRVGVPQDTDLNHYFEIMNTRGEQLEKHEILKSDLISVLSKESDGEQLKLTFNMIWEACSNMEQYIQYGFNPSQRGSIFGNSWDTISCKDFDQIVLLLSKDSKNVIDNENVLSLEKIIQLPIGQMEQKSDTDTPDRFNSIINFPNFLLHVLKIQEQSGSTNIALDDKRLLEAFEPYIKNVNTEERVNFVKNFGFNLLKCKFLFDSYIIKRDNNKEHWNLLKLNNHNNNASYINTFGSDEDENINKDIVMLLAMFHVSFPTLIYKNWFNAVLRYVYQKNDAKITVSEYKIFLENLAKAFVFDRFLAINPIEYDDIIYTNACISKNDDIEESKLDRGTNVENFVFNYLDYLLWNKNKTEYRTFEFIFRSSVEHYYPQHPIEGNISLAQEVLDKFGNLCLISSSINSKLSNYMPAAKKDHYNRNPIIESIKQRLMMKYDTWGEIEINKHGKEMKNIILDKDLSK
jgi:hypothetical protein